jgi:hypothetical protein
MSSANPSYLKKLAKIVDGERFEGFGPSIALENILPVIQTIPQERTRKVFAHQKVCRVVRNVTDILIENRVGR